MKKWKQTAGFTLVELIVVIAILGILAGVGTVGYSGYIKKANMAADQQLVSGIKNALELGNYSNPNGVQGMVVLSADAEAKYMDENGNAITDGTALAASSLYQSVVAAFGENPSLRLRYDGWTGTSMLDVVLSDPTGAEAVVNSSFMQKSDINDLMNQVTTLTGAANEVVSAKSPDEVYYKLAKNLDATELDKLCEQYGLKTEAYTYVDGGGNHISTKKFKDEVDSQVLSNMILLAVANEMKNPSETPSVALGMVGSYTLYAGLALNSTDPQIIEAYNEMCLKIYGNGTQEYPGAASVADVNTALENFGNASGVSVALGNYVGAGGLAATDMSAVQAMLGAVSAASGTVSLEDLANPNLYTSGEVAELFASYVDAANTVAGMSEDAITALQNAANGSVVVYAHGKNIHVSPVEILS